MVIADATVIIALAKIGRLGLLEALYGQAAMGPGVKREVVDQGKLVGAPEVAYVENALEQQWLREVTLPVAAKRLMDGLVRTTRLDDGEAESLALAKTQNLTLLVDDKEARTVARGMGLEYLGTAGVLLHAFLAGRLSHATLAESVKELARVTWLAPDVVAEILRRAAEARR